MEREKRLITKIFLMNKLLMLTLATVTNVVAYSQTIITYGNNTVGKEEFLRAYNKNKTTVTDKEKALREYAELYSNFKLKVKAAEEMGVDTSEQLKNETANFRQQIEDNYLNDEPAFNTLTDEAFQRSLKDLRVLHFMIPSDAAAAPKDTATAFQITNNLYKKLAAGETDYNAIAPPPNVKYTDLGFITAFSLPYQYENIVYGLKVGETSKPWRSKKGWHIFKVIDQRKNVGKWKVAQILFSIPEGAEDKKINAVKKLADSVYGLVTNGKDFATLAQTYSEDKLTYQIGGEMNEFTTGKFDPAFESEVFKLKKDNDVTSPFRSGFGYHIVKRLGVTPAPEKKEDDLYFSEIKDKVKSDNRINFAKDKFAKTVLIKTGCRVNPAIKQSDLFRFADTVVAATNDNLSESLPISNKTVLNFQKGSAKGSDWLNYVKDFKSATDVYKNESNAEIWEKYKTVAALDYYRKHLEDYNPEFRYQLREFREGNMLFEAMEKNVWSKAAADTVGLKKYYEANKEKYKWSASADVLIINCVTAAEAKEAMDSLKGGMYWKYLVEIRQGEVQGDTGRFELSQVGGDSKSVAGSYSPIISNEDGTFTFVKFDRIYAEGEQRSFNDARGMVINDYQNVLEKQWIDSLRKKYPVKINQTVLKTLVQ